MTDARAKELIDLGSRLFGKKEALDSFHQEIAENFYPERANFTTEHYLGRDFCGEVMDSLPILYRRELGNSISAMLRPRERPWFKTTTLDEGMDGEEDNARYLEYHTSVMRRAMYDPRTKFIRATKEGDHDFITFGQGVLSVEEAPSRDHLYYRNHHLRDCAWLENEIGEVDHLHRKDMMSARAMKRRFGEKALHKSVKTACEKNPGQEFPLRVIVMPSDEYDFVGPQSKNKKGHKHPFVIVYIDVDNCKVLREGGLPEFCYVVPRWHTISGSQYAFSPATTIALPDARMAQQLARILLEAGEKAIDPPMLAVEEAVREVNLAAGAITWADIAYDSKLKEAVQPIQIDPNMSVGFAMRTDLREMLTKSFFLDKLSLPPAEAGSMTAYEVGQRIEEHVRNLLPLFEPMEIEYNTRILDKTHALLMNMGAFDFSQLPDDLRGSDISWSFESPIQQAASRTLVQQFQEVLQLVAAATQMGVQSIPVNLDVALRDAIRGTSAPALWRKSAAELEAEASKAAMTEKMGGMLQEVAAGAEVAGAVGEAAKGLQEAGLMKGPATPKALPAPQRRAA